MESSDPNIYSVLVDTPLLTTLTDHPCIFKYFDMTDENFN